MKEQSHQEKVFGGFPLFYFRTIEYHQILHLKQTWKYRTYSRREKNSFSMQVDHIPFCISHLAQAEVSYKLLKASPQSLPGLPDLPQQDPDTMDCNTMHTCLVLRN